MNTASTVSKQLQEKLLAKKQLPCQFRARKKSIYPTEKSQFVFAQFDLIYNRLWEAKAFKNQLEQDEYIEEWNNALEPLIQKEIELVCDRLSMLPQDELPHIIRPKKFVEYCKSLPPEAFKFPTFNQAYNECYLYTKRAHEYVGKRWSHPVIYASSCELFNDENLSQGHQHSEFSLFKRIYMRHIRRHLAGKLYKIPPPVKPLLSPKKCHTERMAQFHLRKIKRMLNDLG